jgi:sulfopropanediol 3-dehydrogenase
VLAADAGSIGRRIVIIADDHADPELIAADLIAACESGPQTRAVLIATSPAVAARSASAIARQLQTLPDGARAQTAWRRRGAIHVVDDFEAACALADHHAPQRVEVMTSKPRWFLERLYRCGELFLGPGAGIALSEDMLARPRAVSRVGELEPLWVGSFLHTVTYRETEACEPSASAAMARHHRSAGLEAHARACDLRAVRDRGGSREG